MSTKPVNIAVILPPRERFRAADAGAVALTVYDFVRASRFCRQITVLGGEKEPFTDVNYHVINSRWSRLLGLSAAYARACGAWLIEQKTDMVEVHNRLILALNLKKCLPATLVFAHIHNDPHTMEGAKTAPQRLRLLQNLDGVYCVSHYVKQRLLEGLDASFANKVHIVYNAVALTSEQTTIEKQPWLVYAGRFVPEKGVLELAQALAEVLPKYPHWHAVFLGAWGFGHVAGRSDYEQQVYAALAQVASQVEFRGHVPQAEVMNVLAQSSITVVPSLCAEAFGRVALEAMLKANAVLVSSFGALPEIAGDAAIVLPEISQVSLAQQLNSLLADNQRISDIAIRCQQRASDNFSLAKQVNVLDDIRQQYQS